MTTRFDGRPDEDEDDADEALGCRRGRLTATTSSSDSSTLIAGAARARLRDGAGAGATGAAMPTRRCGIMPASDQRVCGAAARAKARRAGRLQVRLER